MNFAREGLSFIVIAALVAAAGFGVAIMRRSWPLWLVAFMLTLVALWVAYFFRDPERIGERGERLVDAPARTVHLAHRVRDCPELDRRDAGQRTRPQDGEALHRLDVAA